MVAVDLNTRAMGASVKSVPQSRMMGVSALILALGAHSVFAFLNPEPPIDLAGGNTTLAAQGNSFANMAAGIETPQGVTDHAQDHEMPAAAVTPPVRPVKVTPNASPSKVDPFEAATLIAAIQGGVPLVVVEVEKPSVSLAQPVLSALSLAEGALAVEPVRAAIAEPAVQQEETKSEVEQVEPPEVQPPEPQSRPVMESLRPAERPKPPEPQAVRSSASKPAAKPIAKPRGNGAVNATRGVVKSARSQPGGLSQSIDGRSEVQGNAAASNYADLVMRRIQRAKRRADVRGEAIVRFSINASGGLTAVSLARSSGSGKLDSIALAQVRRAAPFPSPPVGARRSFTVRIKGK